jgi:hypothetical protein
MASVGLVDYSGPWFSDEAKQRGSSLHAWCKQINAGTIEWDTIPPDRLAEVEAYANWRELSNFTALGYEEPLYHPTRHFCGTYDIWGKLGDGSEVVIDIKRGDASWATGVQLCGYAYLLDAAGFGHATLFKRYALHSLSGGRAKPKEFTDRTHFDTFLAALTIAHAKERNR